MSLQARSFPPLLGEKRDYISVVSAFRFADFRVDARPFACLLAVSDAVDG